MQEFLMMVAKKYGLFVIGGATGAVIHRFRTKMDFSKFIISIFISMFVALCIGIVARDYFEMKESLIYVLCGVSGVFSEVILDEIQDLIKSISDIVRSRFGGSSTNFDDFSKDEFDRKSEI